MEEGFIYIIVMFNGFNRRVLSWRLSNSIDGVFCIDALEHAIHYCGEPKIYNADKSDQ